MPGIRFAELKPITGGLTPRHQFVPSLGKNKSRAGIPDLLYIERHAVPGEHTHTVPAERQNNLPEAASVRYADLTACSDDELMLQLQNANGDALAVLFKRYQRLVFSVAMKILRDLGEAEDVTQSAFMQIFHTAKLFDANRGTAKIWILKHAYHLSLNRRRHLTVRKFYTAEEISELTELVPDLAPGDLTFPEKKRLVSQSLSALKEDQRRVLELAFYEGFTLKEIAEQMGETLSNVRHHYYRGIEKLRSHIAPRGEDPCPATSKEALDAEA